MLENSGLIIGELTMARRCKDWEEGLASDLLESTENRKEFFLALLEEGYTWREAINKIVKLIL